MFRIQKEKFLGSQIRFWILPSSTFLIRKIYATICTTCKARNPCQRHNLSYLAENITDAPARWREHCRQLLLWRLEERLPVLVQSVGGQAGEAAPGDGRPLLARRTPPSTTLQRRQLATALPLKQNKIYAAIYSCLRSYPQSGNVQGFYSVPFRINLKDVAQCRSPAP